MELFNKYAFTKAYANFLAKELTEARKEIGFLRSEIDEMTYKPEARMSELEKELNLEKLVTKDLLFKNNKLTTDLMVQDILWKSLLPEPIIQVGIEPYAEAKLK